MKQALIVALVCLNLALLVAMISATTAPAQAQAVGGHGDYLVVNGTIARGEDVIYIIDTGSRRLAAVHYVSQTGRLVPVPSTDLARDFSR